MRKNPPYMTLRGGIWHFVRAVPEDARWLVGKTQWRATLGTGNKAQAAREVRRLLDQTDSEIAQARRMIEAAKPLGLPAEQVDRQSFIDTLESRMAEALDGLKAARAAVETRIAPVREAMGDQIAGELLKSGTIAAEYRTAAAPALAVAEAVGAVGDAIEGKGPQTPRKATTGRVSGGLDDMHALWGELHNPAERTRDEAVLSVAYFKSLCGDKPMGDYTKADLRTYRDALLRKPKHVPMADKSLSFAALLEKYDGRDVERISKVSAQKLFSFVRTMFGVAFNEGHIDENPAEGIKIRGKQGVTDKGAFTVEELKTMFSSAPFSTRERGDDFYFILMSLFTGCRASELLQLRPEDVQTDGGVTFLDIGTTGGRTLKTQQSRRRVPVHPVLLNLGFAGWAKRNRERVFDGIPLGARQLSDPASKRFNRWLDGIGITRREVSLHSTRHSFKSWARTAGVEEAISDALSGHAPATVARRYGEIDLTTLDRAIRSIKCPVDLGRL